MTKKEFEKETYLAPVWGLRVVTVERYFLNGSPEGGEPGGDDNYQDPNNGEDF